MDAFSDSHRETTTTTSPVPPTITSGLPAPGATNVPANTDIVVDFSEAILTPPANSFELFETQTQTEVKDVIITLENDDTSLMMHPNLGLSPHTSSFYNHRYLTMDLSLST